MYGCPAYVAIKGLARGKRYEFTRYKDTGGGRMNAHVTRSCGECIHSRSKSEVLTTCELLKVDVVKTTLEVKCPLEWAKIVEAI